jgi:hypothetical protein
MLDFTNGLSDVKCGTRIEIINVLVLRSIILMSAENINFYAAAA